MVEVKGARSGLKALTADQPEELPGQATDLGIRCHAVAVAAGSPWRENFGGRHVSPVGFGPGQHCGTLQYET